MIVVNAGKRGKGKKRDNAYLSLRYREESLKNAFSSEWKKKSMSKQQKCSHPKIYGRLKIKHCVVCVYMEELCCALFLPTKPFFGLFRTLFRKVISILGNAIMLIGRTIGFKWSTLPGLTPHGCLTSWIQKKRGCNFTEKGWVWYLYFEAHFCDDKT